MKIIFPFFCCLFCAESFAAMSPNYLNQAGAAWESVLGAVGASGEIANYVHNSKNNSATFYDLISVLAYNDTAMMIFETQNHINAAFSDLNRSLISRKDMCYHNSVNCDGEKNNLIVDGKIFGNFADYSSDLNGDFKVNNTGGSIFLKGYISDGWLIGAGYTRNLLDTKDNKVYTDATGNSIALITQYLSQSGFFMNLGIDAGHITWNADKTIAGVLNDSSYDTSFMAGKMLMGMNFRRGKFFMTPKIFGQYMILESDEYTDAAAQSFEKWWYNALTGGAELDFGYTFTGDEFFWTPTISFGGKYDFISNGTDSIKTTVISGQNYFIPVDYPSETALEAGIGLSFYTGSFTAGVKYQFEIRENYYNHSGFLKLNIRF